MHCVSYTQCLFNSWCPLQSSLPQLITLAGTRWGPLCSQPEPGGSREDPAGSAQLLPASPAACGRVACPLHHSITTSAFWPCPSPLLLTLSQLREYLLITSHFPCAASFRTKEMGFRDLFRKGTAAMLTSGHLGRLGMGCRSDRNLLSHPQPSLGAGHSSRPFTAMNRSVLTAAPGGRYYTVSLISMAPED